MKKKFIFTREQSFKNGNIYENEVLRYIMKNAKEITYVTQSELILIDDKKSQFFDG